MSPLEVLRNHYVGKKIVSVPTGLGNYLESTVFSVDFDTYEPMLEFTVKLVDGGIKPLSILNNWNIEVA